MPQLRKQFEYLDANKDGILSFQDIKNVLEIHLSPEENQIFLDIVTNMIQHDKNGTIGYSEFIAMCISRQKLLSRENLIKAFRQIDADNSGLISIQELKAALDAS